MMGRPVTVRPWSWACVMSPTWETPSFSRHSFSPSIIPACPALRRGGPSLGCIGCPAISKKAAAASRALFCVSDPCGHRCRRCRGGSSSSGGRTSVPRTPDCSCSPCKKNKFKFISSTKTIRNQKKDAGYWEILGYWERGERVHP